MAYTSTDLLKIIKKRAFLPVSQETFTDTDLLEMATDEMYSQVVPEVLSTREEWYVTEQNISVDGTVADVDIPSRAIGGSLRDVTFSQGAMEFSLARMDLEDKVYVDRPGPLSAFYLEANQVHLMGSETGVLNLYFNCRPGRLVAVDEAARIVSYENVTDPLTGAVSCVIIVDAVPAMWTTGANVDVVKATPHFDYRNISLPITNINGNEITVGGSLSDKVAVNDWVTAEDTSPAPQIPLEWFPFLAEAVVMQVFQSQGDFDAAARSEKKMEGLKKAALSLMSPRVQGEAKRAVPPKNRSGIFPHRWGR